MRKKILFLMFLFSTFSFAYSNAGLEIRINNFEDFIPYELQYNFNEFDEFAWGYNSLNLIPSDIGNGGTAYVYDDIKLKNQSYILYFRLISHSLLLASETHQVEITPDATNFLELNLINQPSSGEKIVEEIINSNNFLYYKLDLKVQQYEENSLDATLFMPERFEKLLIESARYFEWKINNNSRETVNSYLVIGTSSSILKKINVTGLEEYMINISSNYFTHGEYWWQIINEVGSNKVLRSQTREFYVVDNPDETDTDGDGFFDNDEIVRDYDSNDPTSFPLIIISDNNLPDATIGQQYFYKIQSKGSLKLITWLPRSHMPNGLVVNEHGLISGIPSEKGEFYIDVFAYDDEKYDEKTFRIIIKDPEKSFVDVGKGSIQRGEDNE